VSIAQYLRELELEWEQQVWLRQVSIITINFGKDATAFLPDKGFPGTRWFWILRQRQFYGYRW